MSRCGFSLFIVLGSAGLLSFLRAQDSSTGPDANRIASLLQDKYATARQYSFDSEIELARKNGGTEREIVLRRKTKLAVAPDDRFLLWVGDKQALDYLVVSDGHRTWAYVPAMNKYADIEAVVANTAADPDHAFLAGVTDLNRDPMSCLNLVMPILSHLIRHVQLVEINRSVPILVNGEEHDMPVLTAVSERTDQTGQNLAEVVLDPETLAVYRLHWTKSASFEDESRFAFLTIDFDRLAIGETIPASSFTFAPGDAQKVQELPLPGLTGASLIGQTAPDCDVATVDGKRTRMSALRGRPVLLVFTNRRCAPCRKQADTLQSIASGRERSSPVLVEVGEDNPSLYRHFEVRFWPTVVIVDSRGVVTHFLPGAHDASDLLSMLRDSGPTAPP